MMEKDDYLLLVYVGVLALGMCLQGRELTKLTEEMRVAKLKIEWLDIVARETEKS